MTLFAENIVNYLFSIILNVFEMISMHKEKGKLTFRPKAKKAKESLHKKLSMIVGICNCIQAGITRFVFNLETICLHPDCQLMARILN